MKSALVRADFERDIVTELQRLRTLAGGLPDDMIVELVPVLIDTFPNFSADEIREGCDCVLEMEGYTDAKQVIAGMRIVEDRRHVRYRKQRESEEAEKRRKENEERGERLPPGTVKKMIEDILSKSPPPFEKRQKVVPMRTETPDQKFANEWHRERLAWATENKRKIQDYPIRMEDYVAVKLNELAKLAD